jgi:hypothetical protein
MAEKIKASSKTLLLSFYLDEKGNVEVESSADPWLEGELGNILVQRSSQNTQAILDSVLRGEYERLSKKNK